MKRIAKSERKTNETAVKVELIIEGTGKGNVSTGIGFLDHILHSFIKHGLFDATIEVKGDLEVDGHHTVEDIGIVLGRAFNKSLGEKRSITRFASVIIPFDDALILCAIDVGGRSYLVFDANLPYGKIGELDIELVEEFFKAFVADAGINLHLKVIAGKNVHHIIEAMFKAFGVALSKAVTVDERINGIQSTKGAF